MASSKNGSRRGLLKARSEDNTSSSHFDAEEGDSDSEEEEDATKPGTRHFGVWVMMALLCAILAIFCAVYGLSLKDSGTTGEAGEDYSTPESEDTEHMPASGLLTNAEFRWFKWTPLKRTAEESVLDAFRFGMGWANARFTEGREGPKQAMTKEYVAEWVTNTLLVANPFGKEDAVPVPLSPLKKGHFVGYTRRQICYIVAQSLLGARTEGYDNYLARYLDGEDACGSDSAGHSPRTGTFGRAMWNLLAACAADPCLSGVGHGPLVLVVVAEKVEEKVEKLKQIASYAPLEGAGLRVCRYGDGATDLADPIYSKGEQDVPQEGCIPPTAGGPGRDFLTGGLRNQAVLATALGESLPCDSRSERHYPLLEYMPEAAALLLFLSNGDAGPMSEFPFWLLGARKIMVGLDGTGRFNSRFELDTNLSFNSDLEKVIINGSEYKMSSSRPLLAYIGASLDFLNISGMDEDQKALEVSLARRNINQRQREEPLFDQEVQTWYNAMALTSYPKEIRPAMRTLVHSLGTGPWLSGLAWGDSQLGMLAMWIAHSMAAQTWSDGQEEAQDCADNPSTCLPLDYYVYSDFSENPGNQCLVHAEDECEKCLSTCSAKDPRGSDFHMPQYAYMAPNQTCVLNGNCGKKSFRDVMSTYTKHLASSLWDQVLAAMKAESDSSTNRSIFDLLLLYNVDE